VLRSFHSGPASFQSALVLSETLREHYKQNLIKWLVRHKGNNYLHEHEINHTQRLIDYLDVVKTPHSETFEQLALLNDFNQFYSQYDTRRGLDFRKTFPNLQDWYDSL